MTIYELPEELVFPDPREAEESGLLAVGGDLNPERVLLAYSLGIFPWYEEEPILWFSPNPRLVLRPTDIHISRSLQKVLQKEEYSIRADTAFEQVIRECQEAFRPGQDGTWITEDLIDAFCQLHQYGYAHSIEAWKKDELVGGLYGLSIGGTFFGESMFAKTDNASKVAFASLAKKLEEWDFDLIDCQVTTTHLARFGAEEWDRDKFLRELRVSMDKKTRRGEWTADFVSSHSPKKV